MLQVIKDYPPLIDEIGAQFNVRGKAVIYAWGDRIFAPMLEGKLAPEIIAHEAVHGERQLAGRNMALPADYAIVKWWRAYLADQSFRLAEEIPAHVAEYEVLAARHDNAAWRRQVLNHVAMRLRADLYRYEPKLALHAARGILTRNLKDRAGGPGNSVSKQQ